MTIYIATSGEYSDYHIDAVFTDKEQCLLYCATHGCELEEHEADEVKLESTQEVKEEWQARFHIDRGFDWVDKRGYCFDEPIRIRFRPHHFSHFITAALPVGTNEEKAKKIFCDMYAQYKQQEIEKGRNVWTA
jgi:hypothetical protein